MRKDYEQRDAMRQRAMDFGLRIIHLTESVSRTQTARVLGHQLLRAGTSVGANYRSALRAKSRADFIAKLGIVEEEADEAIYWMDMLIASGLVKKVRVAKLLDEANQIVAIVVASIKTARLHSASPKSGIRHPK
jgi:four helix bundle protein